MIGRLRRRLRDGLAKTRKAFSDQLSRIGLRGRVVDADLLDELEEALIESDLGPALAADLREGLEKSAKGRKLEGEEDLLAALRDELVALLPEPTPPAPVESGPRVTMLLGVNGSGKTTTAGKLVARWSGAGRDVVVAAADTFRAAAVEQLVVWSERAGARVVKAASGADPAAVAFDAAASARAQGADDLLIDTAGRLHTKKPLMAELEKISRVVAKEIPGAPHESLLVLDGTTGRNAVQQAKDFASIVPVTGIVLTKLDGTARGGAVVSVGRELGIPVRYVGVGESADDLLDFDPHEFVRGLLVIPSQETSGSEA